MKHTQAFSIRSSLLGATLLGVATAWAQQPVGQWDFNSGNLNGAPGTALAYRDGVGTGFQFGTTTALGIPDIGGTAANVLKVPAGADATSGLNMPVAAAANGGSVAGLVNDYTLVMDVLFPAAADKKVRALLDSDGGTTDPDAEIFVTAANAFGAKNAAFGVVTTNRWYRLGLVVDGTGGKVRLYVDGAEVGSAKPANQVDGRYALASGAVAGLFTDDSGETAIAYVNSIQLRDVALAKPQMLALGGAQAAGIPTTLPPVPSSVEKWIPAGEFASRNTDIGAVINVGDTTVQNASITLKLNGVAVTAPSITRDGSLITVKTTPAPFTPGTEQTIEVTYTDSLAGVKTLTRKFGAALFYEDFDGLALVPRKDESNAATEAFEQGWTNRPPAGWIVDNSQFLATIISAENPDDDGDGYADLDGRTEWAGWSFANKDFWLAADNQTRDQFTLASGNVAIADPDEWDDQSHLKSLFNSFLKTPEISLAGIAPGTAFLKFASSWRPEGFDDRSPSDSTTGFPTLNNDGTTAINNQTAIITVKFDNGAPVQVLKYDSKDGSPTFKPDAQNEQVLLPLNNPAGATKMVLSFELRDGANDWWWAIDNVVVSAGAAPPTIATQATAIEANEGTNAALTVVPTGDTLSFQWYKGFGVNRTLVAGATTATLNFAPLKVEDAGYYSVEVKNTVGAVTSNPTKVAVLPVTDGRLTLLTEDFETLVLGPNRDETTVDETAWTHTGPTGWVTDNSGVPGAGTENDGVTEWAGWSFADKTFWATAGGQNRAAFTKGIGTVVVGDSDEWDDQGHEPGNMATYLKTKEISLDGVKAGSVIVKFDSSWNPEEPQKGNVVVSFDGGAPVEILRLESGKDNAGYRPAELSETIALRVNNPAGAKKMTITFGYFETLNNWWWAFDNLVVLGSPAPIFAENFDGLVLGPNVEEGITVSPTQQFTAVWTKTAPAGWAIDDTGVPGVGNPATDGVTEWAGWSFADKTFWANAGGQDRAKFTKGTGTVAVADSDEWDDSTPKPNAGNMATFLATPAINIAGRAANSLYLTFSSSFRAEAPQKASVKASFDGGPAVDLIQWVSSPETDPKFKNNLDETVTVPLFNPAGASTVKLTFGYFDTRNNWWWAVDNIEVNVGAVVPPVSSLEVSSATVSGENLVLNWTGGTGPFLVQGKLSLSDANWLDLQTVTGNTASIPLASPIGFFRVVDGATKTVKLFKATLNAAQEVATPPVASPATGVGLLALDGTTVTYVVSYENLVGTITAAHLHGPAAAGANAGVKIGFVVVTGTKSGVIAGQATADASTVTAIEGGNTYFNVHTTSFGGGEIRGQVTPVQ
jgi:hypothetical protein